MGEGQAHRITPTQGLLCTGWDSSPTDLKVEHYTAADEAEGRAETVEYVGGECCLISFQP